MIRVIDLFCGAGGLSLGLSMVPAAVIGGGVSAQHGAAFSTVWANDFDASAAATFTQNFGDVCVVGDLTEILREATNADAPRLPIPRADLVVGGPPCQGFSLLNKARAADPRKQLWRPFMDVVASSGAHAFVMENVPQLLGSTEHKEILCLAHARGFTTWSGALRAADYGVPQNRLRAFIVGSLGSDPGGCFPPPPSHHAPASLPASRSCVPGDKAAVAEPPVGRSPTLAATLQPWRTVRDAIADLSPPEGTEIRSVPPPLDLHFGRRPTELSRARYRAIPKEGMNRFDLQRVAPELTPACWKNKPSGSTDLFGRLWWNRPSVTIRTEFFKPEKGRYLHPEQHRPITHREAARLQSFPDDFVFVGSKNAIARQIGNAVPPSLAAAIGRALLEMFAERSPAVVERQSSDAVSPAR